MTTEGKSLSILHLLGRIHLPKQPDHDAASGVVRVALELARLQARQGHRVTVATSGSPPWEVRWEGVRLVNFAEWPWAKFTLRSHVLDFRQHGAFVVAALRDRYDVIHAHNYGYLRFLRASQKLMHFHSDPLWGQNHPTSSNRGWTAADFRLIKRSASKVVAVSRFVQRQVSSAMGHDVPVHVVPNGVDASLYNPMAYRADGDGVRRRLDIPADAVCFLYCGAINAVKGVATLASAFAEVARTNPEVHLIVAGAPKLWGTGVEEDSYEIEVRRRLLRPEIQDRVHFLGLVGQDAMPGVYQAADVVVVPSISEAFGMAALEAMASGKPVIASNIGGLPELVNDAVGVLVPPGDMRALVEAMTWLLSDEKARRTMGEHARAASCVRTWEESQRRIQALYHV